MTKSRVEAFMKKREEALNSDTSITADSENPTTKEVITAESLDSIKETFQKNGIKWVDGVGFVVAHEDWRQMPKELRVELYSKLPRYNLRNGKVKVKDMIRLYRPRNRPAENQTGKSRDNYVKIDGPNSQIIRVKNPQ